MSVAAPHYLLFSQASRTDESGLWRFVLRAVDGSKQLEASDVEPKVRGERLDLLAVVRGLEALDQPSRVTLIGCSHNIKQAIQYSLSEWRGNGWRWEFFGQMVPVKNGDLWQRLDRALQFHQVGCRRQWRLDGPHRAVSDCRAAAAEKSNEETGDSARRVAPQCGLECRVSPVPAGLWRQIAAVGRLWWRRLTQSCRTVIFYSRGG